jgi:CBS domain-containing protein
MKVGEVMIWPVAALSLDTPVLQAARVILSEGVSGLPVIDEDRKVLGVVSEGDLIRRLGVSEEHPVAGLLAFLSGGISAAEFTGTKKKTVREVMSCPPLTIGEDEMLEDALKMMEHHKVKRIPVLRDNRLIGILSRQDLLRAAVKLADATTSA